MSIQFAQIVTCKFWGDNDLVSDPSIWKILFPGYEKLYLIFHWELYEDSNGMNLYFNIYVKELVYELYGFSSL